MKARAAGLAIPLDAFAVSLTPAPCLTRVAEPRGTAGDWHVARLAVPPAFSGAVVVSRDVKCISGWQAPVPGVQ